MKSNKLIEFLSTKSAFRHMAICAILIGVGDVLCAVTDLYWVLGDMSVQIHFHHWVVLIGLSVANILIGVSFVWLVKSIYVYTLKHPKKVAEKRTHKHKISKQSEIILHLNARIDALEKNLENK